LEQALGDFKALREVEVGYDVPSCITFQAAPWRRPSTDRVQRNQAQLIESRAPVRPASDEALAFLPVVELAGLLRGGQVTPTQLTILYLDRLRQLDPKLKCVVTLTESLALKQAAKADREISAGIYRGPLHGIPWGAKDLIAYPGYPTTWGAPAFRGQQLDVKATVAGRLEEAGAVLVAKLSLGALAQGDKWFGGMTRNPWNIEQGSSGSSAGSASAVVAGLVGFAIGSETLGSIISPCRRCGATGLRPTFGRVSRHGCMALAWSMDKLGPIARCVEDCALVLDAIHGFDGEDASAVDEPFQWPPQRELTELRVGYVRGENSENERDELTTLRELGVQLVPIELPSKYPEWSVALMLGTEAGTIFDPLMRAEITEGLNSWPGTFRRAQFAPAVEYLRASRVRTLMMQEMRELMQSVDLYVNGDDLGLTNLTGHPSVVLPSGFTLEDGKVTPRTVTFTGQLFGETELLSVARAFERARSAHLEHPPLS
jgi:Asp-tRNA(Asn)/Glu-tRNA(Gln) amidotransferase A subunit family amidase